MRIQETKVYTFEELSDKAKDKARDWYRSASDGDMYWSEYVIEDASTIADILGIELYTRPTKLMNETIRRDPCIWWSGFSSQGDGACYEGRYRYSQGSLKKLQGHIGKESQDNKELYRIAQGLAAIQRKYFYGLVIVITRGHNSNHYSHSNTMAFDSVGDRHPSGDDHQELASLLRSFADWIYSRLEAEYIYVNSDEAVDETIQGNEYEFTEEGKRC